MGAMPSFFLLLSLAGAGMASRSASAPSLFDLGLPTQPVRALGSAFDTERMRAPAQDDEPCVRGRAVWRRNAASRIRVYLDQDFSSLYQETSGGIGGGLQLLLVAGRGSLQHISEVAKTSQSTSLITLIDLKQGDLALEDRELTEKGRAAALLSPEARKERCGTGFIDSVELGGRLYLSVVLDFKDQRTLERLRKRLQFSLLFGMMEHESDTTKILKEEFRGEGFMRVIPFQEGGDQRGLQAILGASASRTTCTFDDIELCQKTYQSLLAYAKSGEGFAASSELQTIRHYSYAGYSSSGHDELESGLPSLDSFPEFYALIQMRAEQLALLDKIEAFADWRESPYKPKLLAQWQANVASNVAAIDQAIRRCQAEDVSSCRDMGKRLPNSLLPSFPFK